MGTSTSEAAATAAFVALVVANAALILPSRFSHWGAALLRDLPGVSAVVLGGTLAALMAITMFAPFAAAFGFAVLPARQWGLAAGCGLGLLAVFQCNKWLLRD